MVNDRDDTWSYNNFTPGIGHVANNAPGLIFSSTVTQVLRPTVVNEMNFGYTHHRCGFTAGEETTTKNTFDYTTLYASNVLPGLTVPRLQPFGDYSDPPTLSKFGGPQVDQWPYAPIYTTSASSRAAWPAT